MTTEKFCTRCGRKFIAVGREVICPSCKAAAAEESKKAAVMRAKKASWTGESVPVRISGRASTVIRAYGAANNLPFAQALDALLQASDYFKGVGKAWDDITPYKSRRRDKHATETTSTPQEVKQDEQEVKQDAPQASKPQEAQGVKQTAQAAKTSKAKSTAKKAASKTSKGGKA